MRRHRNGTLLDSFRYAFAGLVYVLRAERNARVHLAATVNDLLRSSRAISDAVDAGRLAIIGLQYRLTEGRAVPYTVVGPVDVETAPLD